MGGEKKERGTWGKDPLKKPDEDQSDRSIYPLSFHRYLVLFFHVFWDKHSYLISYLVLVPEDIKRTRNLRWKDVGRTGRSQGLMVYSSIRPCGPMAGHCFQAYFSKEKQWPLVSRGGNNKPAPAKRPCRPRAGDVFNWHVFPPCP